MTVLKSIYLESILVVHRESTDLVASHLCHWKIKGKYPVKGRIEVDEAGSGAQVTGVGRDQTIHTPTDLRIASRRWG
jgi:hypothetical protein